MTGPDRIRCEAIGCRRTASAAKCPKGTIIICGKCWRFASQTSRAAWRAARKAGEAIEGKAVGRSRLGWPVFATDEDGIAFEAAWAEEQRLWAVICGEINEGRGGIA